MEEAVVAEPVMEAVAIAEALVSGLAGLGGLRDGEVVPVPRVVQVTPLCDRATACRRSSHPRSSPKAGVLARASGGPLRST